MLDLAGKVLKSYEVQERIGAGGFGAVFRAIQPTIGREVAVKIILPQYANQPEFVRRFEVEAQLVARLEHPHIVPLYDYWRGSCPSLSNPWNNTVVLRATTAVTCHVQSVLQPFK